MKRSAYAFVLAMLTSAGICQAQAPDPRPGATTPVQVMNGSDAPVPVVGAVTGTVSLATDTKVAIDGVVHTRSLDGPGGQPIILSCEADRDSCFTDRVPAGKRMVVQMISANLAGDNLNGSVTPVLRAVRFQQAGAGGTEGKFDLFVPLEAVGIFNSYYPFWVATHAVSLVLDEGKGLHGGTDVATTGTSKPRLGIYAHGYLVDK